MMGAYRFLAVFGLSAMLFVPQTSFAQDNPVRDPVESCKQLRNPEFLAKLYKMQEAPTVILKTTVVPAGGNNSIIEKDLPEHCRVEGMVEPSVGFLLRLPTKTWNGKFMMGGCGGACGQYLTDRIDPALVKGYAVVVTDMGHKGNGNNLHTLTLQGQVDFGYRSTHVTTVAAKTIVEAFYKKKPTRNYFWGCSTGGGQAVVEAELFPHDFEGIIGGAPVLGGSQFGAWRGRFNAGKDGKPILDASKGPLVHKAAVEACHAPDGLNDGIVQNPLKCDWDPAAIQCKPGANARDCLTPEEVAVVRLVFDGPRDEKGRKQSWGIAPRGSESVWDPEKIPGQDFIGLNVLAVEENGSPRPLLEPWYRNAWNPDFRAFRSAGGKFILFHGLADPQLPPGSSADFYESIMREMGGEAETKEFFRFFLLPAVEHCRYGLGGGEVDWIGALENWVERGNAPDQVTTYHMVKEPYPMVERAVADCCSPILRTARHPLDPADYDRSRPVFAYPDTAQWSGKGDPNKPDGWVKAPR